MVYVFDSNSFGVLKNFYPAAFPTFWEHFDVLVDDGRVLSVREVAWLPRKGTSRTVHKSRTFVNTSMWSGPTSRVFSPEKG